MLGKIIKGIAGFYYVYGEDEMLYECKAKGIFRKDNQKPLVGDNVEITVLDEQEHTGNLIRILPRKNSLIRPAVANVDQAFVIFAMENPKPNFMLLDRFLIMMEQQGIPAVICFNKKDIGEEKELERLYKTYTGCGYQVILSKLLVGTIYLFRYIQCTSTDSRCTGDIQCIWESKFFSVHNLCRCHLSIYFLDQFQTNCSALITGWCI